MVQVEPEATDIELPKVVSTWNGHYIEVLVSGDLDLLAGEPLRRSFTDVERSLNGGSRDLNLDMSEVSFVDVAGFRSLLKLHELVGLRGGAMRVVNANAQAERLFKLVVKCGHAVPFYYGYDER